MTSENQHFSPRILTFIIVFYYISVWPLSFYSLKYPDAIVETYHYDINEYYDIINIIIYYDIIIMNIMIDYFTTKCW